MRIHDIALTDWPEFFADCTRLHRGHPATITVRTPKGETHEAAQALPFVGLSGDWKDGEQRVFITVGDQNAAHLTHAVTDPVRIRLRHDEGAGVTAIEVEALDGEQTLVRFAR